MNIKAAAILFFLAFWPGLQVANCQDSWNETLRGYLLEADSYKKLGEREKEAGILNAIAGDYFNMGVYKKAALYYEQEFSLHEKTNYNGLASSSELAGKSYMKLPLDSLAALWYETSASFFEAAGDDSGLLRCRKNLGLLYTELRLYNKALKEYEEIISVYTRENDIKNIAVTYNQTGFLIFRQNDIDEALVSFTKAIEFSEKSGKDDYFLTDAWSNKAICYQNLGNDKEMLACFKKALEYAGNSGRKDEAARIERLMAMIYFKGGDNYHAEVYCLSSIESAKTSGNLDVLQLCYRDYSEVLENGNDFIKALEFYEKHLNLRDSLNYERRLAEEINQDKIAEYETIEQSIKDDIAFEEIQGLELRNQKEISLRREQEINLLVKQQELDRSDKERLNFSLAYEREKSARTIREQEIISLQRQQEIDSLRILKQESDSIVMKTELSKKELQIKQEEERAEKARQIRNMAVGLGVMMGLVAVMILFGLISTRKKNQKLAESKRQIEKINADLEQTNSEVLKQKEIIELKNQSITDSIQYASRIQTAVLPPVNFLDDWGIENFILFKPKDIVSGDFYWGVKKNEKIIVAAADCTGHGVPGAFMSMLGHAFLDEIINTREVENAATILNILRDEIINTLKQKGTTGEARDGMDISLVIIDRKAGRLEYAGANNPLYIVRDGKMLKFMADRMPIGIHFISFTPFANQSIEIKKDDTLYLFSDGYADQFGGPRGKKFMYKPFQDLLLRISSEPTELQKEILDKTFGEWKKEREQVDDVMVIGIRI